ncbi:hypothetical protein ACLMJK_007679 [Lecanora helva]
MALETSKWDSHGEQFELTVKLLLRFSFTCASISELLFTRRIAQRMNPIHPGYWWHRLSPVAILTFTLVRFLPLISLHKEALHFWTVFSVNFLEGLVFGLVYWVTFVKCKEKRKWRSGLARSCILCSAIVLAISISLVAGCKLPWIRHLLLEILLLLISIHFSLRSVYVEKTLTKRPERLPDEASDESLYILKHGTGSRNTSTSRKLLSRDTNDAIELYAFSISQHQVAGEQGIPGGKIDHSHCTIGGIRTESGNIEALRKERSDQGAPSETNSGEQRRPNECLEKEPLAVLERNGVVVAK